MIVVWCFPDREIGSRRRFSTGIIIENVKVDVGCWNFVNIILLWAFPADLQLWSQLHPAERITDLRHLIDYDWLFTWRVPAVPWSGSLDWEWTKAIMQMMMNDADPPFGTYTVQRFWRTRVSFKGVCSQDHECRLFSEKVLSINICR